MNLFCQNGLEIYFVDVGQGDCTLIVTDNNTKILIDGGGSNNKNYDIGKNTTLPYLLDRRINCLDYVIISHFDSDHVQGLFAVLNNIKVKNIVIAWQKESSDNYEKMLEIARSNNIKIEVVEAGDRILFDKNTYLDILWPNSQNMISENFLNNNSIVAKLVYKTFSVLFTGDIEGVAEKAIIDTNANALNATVLKVAHHGSKTSSIIDFLKSVKPKIALIGVGENNIFGHPSQITLNNLNLIGTQVYRTDKNGEIVITVNRWNQKISVNTFNNISK